MGRIAKGVKCSVSGCDKEAARSLPNPRVSAAGLKVGTGRRAFLCKDHYKEYKKKTKTERKLEKWRHQG
ncbi:MAG: hypothetical protein JSW53_02210 [Candidatus Bathyarchaeota archaeon]|nr:MAG: hypothetical protein JSW53_02210 [Candidatus Bathyarchaeota archaeon]